MLIQAALSALLTVVLRDFQPVSARFIQDPRSLLFSGGSPSSADGSSSSAAGLLTCVCNTQECRSQGTNRCAASNLCYAQYAPARRQRGAKRDQYVRGCINRSTPLLCENRPPSLLDPQLQSAWPVLHCCSSDMCNKVVPATRQPSLSPTTLPPNAESSPVDSSASTRVPIPPFHQTFARLRATDDVIESEEVLEEEERDIHQEQNPESQEAEEDADIAESPSASDEVNKAILSTDVSEHANHFDLSGWKILYVVIPLIVVIILGTLVIIGLIALRRAQFVSTENLVQRGTLAHANKQLTIDYISKPPKVQNKEVIQPDTKDIGYMSANTYSSLYELEAPPRRFPDTHSPGRTLANSTYCNDQFFQYSSRHL
ncbi:hypothetical protein RvY_17045 [Ramazzottius varieornatus]|uniref:Activin types I and II receptor domain-containing protein n=1 Tax=Ramazzottius varieornatus TaxID=947166 RepID=A0A1D1W0Q2_RAMVA|nr:hypothetical protein RvY_17045 [Ramazzottius varieornatus]